MNTKVSQGKVLSPILFNIYISKIPLPKKRTTYANNITNTAVHPKRANNSFNHIFTKFMNGPSLTKLEQHFLDQTPR